MKLYIVGTPIGNLGDMSPRAVKTLEEVDFIAAEDTRVTLKLLNHFGIKKPLRHGHLLLSCRSGDCVPGCLCVSVPSESDVAPHVVVQNLRAQYQFIFGLRCLHLCVAPAHLCLRVVICGR